MILGSRCSVPTSAAKPTSTSWGGGQWCPRGHGHRRAPSLACCTRSPHPLPALQVFPCATSFSRATPFLTSTTSAVSILPPPALAAPSSDPSLWTVSASSPHPNPPTASPGPPAPGFLHGPASLWKVQFPHALPRGPQDRLLGFPCPCSAPALTLSSAMQDPRRQEPGVTHLHLEDSILGTVADVTGGDEVHTWGRPGKLTSPEPTPCGTGVELGPSRGCWLCHWPRRKGTSWQAWAPW